MLLIGLAVSSWSKQIGAFTEQPRLLDMCAMQGLHLWQQPARHQLCALHHPSHPPTYPPLTPPQLHPQELPRRRLARAGGDCQGGPLAREVQGGPHTPCLACCVWPVGAGAHLATPCTGLAGAAAADGMSICIVLSAHPLTHPNRPPPCPFHPAGPAAGAVVPA